MQKTALILGGTGLVGSHLMEQLTQRKEYDKIFVLTRRKIQFDSEKIIAIVTDFKDYSFISELPKIDSVFSCLGTTKNQTPDKTEYLAIEIGIPSDVIKTLEQTGNHPSKIHIVSAIGANPKVGNFYIKMKGELETLIKNSFFNQKFIYQPAVILGERNRPYKMWEKLVFSVSKLMDKILKGKSMKYHTIEAKQIAKAMIHYDVQSNPATIKVLLYNEMIIA